MKRKILIFGVTGMLGHTLFSELSENENHDVYGTARMEGNIQQWFNRKILKKILLNIDVTNNEVVRKTIKSINPDIVINCVGIIKQLATANDPLVAIPINSIFPHVLASFCKVSGTRMIHISTDCVYNGKKGYYNENDLPNANDLYGRTKALGEVNHDWCITLRTSIIGHELKGKYGLIEWFLSQSEKIRGYLNAVYTGFPTVEIAHIIDKYVIPMVDLSGIYNLSSDPISKYELLKQVALKYKKEIEIEPYSDFFDNKSLDSTYFRLRTGYHPPTWKELIDKMYNNYQKELLKKI